MSKDGVEIKRCPFCGAEVRAYRKKGDSPAYFACPNERCGAVVTFNAGNDKTQTENIRLWNRRAEF
jgi:uncharacterized C2H2 Zn-finger protein